MFEQICILSGLALDYCVAYTCKDAARAGFRAWCVEDACRGIAPDSVAAERAAMAGLGVRLLPAADDVPTRDVDDAANGVQHNGTAAAAASGSVAGAQGHIGVATDASGFAVWETLRKAGLLDSTGATVVH
jgi:hypothetical protein